LYLFFRNTGDASVSKPLGISTYTTKAALPKNLKDFLPSPEEIAEHLKIFQE